MEVQFRRSVVSGRLKAPPSPAASHRALIAAMLAPGQSVISNLPQSQDVQATIGACRAFGADILVEGGVADIFGGMLSAPDCIDCGPSRSTLNLFMGVSSLFGGSVEFRGNEALSTVPIGAHLGFLSSMGISVENENGFLPARLIGHAQEARIIYPAALGQRLLSGMLLAAPALDSGTEIAIEGNLHSRQPLDATIGIMKSCGIEFLLSDPDFLAIQGGQSYSALGDFEVPGSVYLSSFILLAAALSGRVTVEGVPASPQLEGLFKSFGAEAKSADGGFFVSAGPLEGTELDAALLGRNMLHAVALGSIAHGETRISNIAANSRRNADRVRLLIRVLSRMGANINESEHSLIINGGRLTGAEIDCEGDPYVAMAASAAALSADGPTHLKGAESATGAYPGFFSDLSGIGAIAREMQKLR